MPQSCAPKFVAVWPCSRSFIFFTRAAQRWRTWLVFPRMARSTLSVSCGVGPYASAIVSWWSRASCFVFQTFFFYHHIHKQCYHSTFFFFTFCLPSFVVCWFAWLLHKHHVLSFKKKNSNHRTHKHCSLSIPLFFLTSFVFADSDGRFMSITFSFKIFFRHIHEHCCYLSHFLFQRHLRFFGKWFVISWQTVGTLFCSLLYRKY